jgi:hypothetical protein
MALALRKEAANSMAAQVWEQTPKKGVIIEAISMPSQNGTLANPKGTTAVKRGQHRMPLAGFVR